MKPGLFKLLDDLLQSKEKKIKLKYYDQWSRQFRVNEEAMGAIHYLTNYTDVLIPIKDAPSWQEGVIRALDDFNRKCLIEAMPEAYNNYKTQLDLNIKSSVENQKDIDFRKGRSDLWKNHILEGRKLFGEPENFDFLDLEE